MALFSFFKAPRHQQFKYVPRYYDPQKERLDEIIKNAKGEGSGDTELIKSRISRNFQNRGSSQSYRSSVTKRSNILLLVILIALFVLAYLLLTVYLPRFLQQIEG
jgi:preprotein translocase subunit SecY